MLRCSVLHWFFILPIFISDTKLYHWLGSDRSSIFSGRRFVQMWGQCNSNLWNEVGVIHASGWQKTPNQNSFCSDDGRDWKRYRGKVTSIQKWRNIKSKLYIYWGISDSKYHLVYQRRKGKHLITYYLFNIKTYNMKFWIMQKRMFLYIPGYYIWCWATYI